MLSDTERKHLILTGKNGSGKTSLLEAIREVVAIIQRQANVHKNIGSPFNDTLKKIYKYQL